MTKYILKEQIPNTDYKVGKNINPNIGGQFGKAEGQLLILLAVKLGILEEVKEEEKKEFPQNGDNYHFVSDTGYVVESYFDPKTKIDQFRQKTGNIYRTKKEAQQALDKIMKGELLESK